MAHYVYYAIQKDGTPKIGATENPSVRCLVYLKWNLLETYDCPWKCGDREIELQQQYFGKRDTGLHYAVLKQMLKTPKFIEGRKKGGELIKKRHQEGRYANVDKSVFQTEEYKTKMSEITKSIWKNERENMMHNRPRGSNHYLSKLTEEDVKFIRKVYFRVVNKFTAIPKGKMNSKQLEDKFNCDKTTILRVASGKTWKHIK